MRCQTNPACCGATPQSSSGAADAPTTVAHALSRRECSSGQASCPPHSRWAASPPPARRYSRRTVTWRCGRGARRRRHPDRCGARPRRGMGPFALRFRGRTRHPQRGDCGKDCCGALTARWIRGAHVRSVRAIVQRIPSTSHPASPRIYERRLFVSGVDPGPGFDGILDTTTPRALNEFSSVEGRFPDGGTYQIGTQLDNLNHIAVGDYFYNGFVGADIAATSGTTKLGAEHIGPVITEESCSMSCPTNWRVRRAVTWSKLPMAVSHFARTTASRSRT